MFNIDPQRSEKTIEFYKYRGWLNYFRAALALGMSPEKMNPLDSLIWLDSLLFGLKPRTRRVYIASFKWWLHHMRLNKISHGGWPKDLDEAIAKINLMKSDKYNVKSDSKSKSKKSKKPGNTSSNKEKSVDIFEIFDIEDELLNLSRKTSKLLHKWTDDVFTFMYANILVGLRPCEWQRAYLKEVEVEVDNVVTKRLCLIIYNAKTTNGRGHGEMRHIVLTEMAECSKNLIRKQLDTVKNHKRNGISWEQYYNGISAELRRMTRRYLKRPGKYPTYPTLYSTRHQFVANSKLAGLNDDEIAALLGHATDLTASLHYAKKHKGTGGFCVKPIASEVAKIKLVKKPNKYAVAYHQTCRI
jgi:hypothetical protein